MNVLFDIPGLDEQVSSTSSDCPIPSKGTKIELLNNKIARTVRYVVREVEFKMIMTKIVNIYCDSIIIYLEECD
ncbi:MAG: hypothetical protein PHF86_06370 [Candidatus Nanoarchaeia archaeon]|jgi:hypothetical protein|nr:hypothetical protein [Candidatus Nanoarchaeia archaeon]